MKLTPLDIKKQEFTRSFRGVDAQEVYNFLQMVGDQWNNLLDENRRLEQKVSEYDNKLEHYRKIEEALQEALETARDNSHKTIENAQREAQIILKEARNASEEIRKKASTDHKRLKHDISKIGGRRDEVVARLRAFLMSELELLSRFEGQDPISYVRLDAGDSKQLRGRDLRNEVNINAMYHSQAIPLNHMQDPPVDLPVDEQETSYEEEDRFNDAFNETNRAETNRAETNRAETNRAETNRAEAQRPGLVDHARDTNAPHGNSNHDDAQQNNNENSFDLKSAGFSLVQDDALPHQPTSSEGLSTDELEFIKSTVSSATQKAVDDDIFKPAEPEVDEAWKRTMANNFPSSTNGQPREQPPKEQPFRREPQRESGLNARANEHAADGSGAGWIVKPTGNTGSATRSTQPPNKPNLGGFASPLFGTESDQDDLSATPEEIEKIRRILNDLD